MPYNNVQQALSHSFTRPIDDDEGPQIFTLEFECPQTMRVWIKAAEETAQKLRIPLEHADEDIVPLGAQKLHVAVLHGDDYTRLCQAMQPALEEAVKEYNETTEQRFAAYDAYLDRLEAEQDNDSAYDWSCEM